MKIPAFILSIVCILGYLGSLAYTNIFFDIHCGERIKRAADANTVELAKIELKAVTEYLETNHMTQGYTSVIYKSPADDVGFWYTNLKESLKELEALPKTSSPLEKSNMLKKLRETLLDGSVVTKPPGIPFFPLNKVWAFWGVMSLLPLLCVILIAWMDEQKKCKY